MLALALLAGPAAAESSATSRSGNLGGVHLNIVTVHADGFMDVGCNDGAFKPQDEWDGYLRDVVDWIAARSNFTFTLAAPTGQGSACVNFTGSAIDFATQYNCGQQDVTDLGNADAYLGMFYITAERLTASTFTIPFESNVGLSLVVPLARRTSLFESTTRILSPFTWDMWLATALTIIFVSMTVTIMEHSGKGYGNISSPEDIACEYRRQVAVEELNKLKVKSPEAAGYLRAEPVLSKIPDAVSDSVYTLTAHGNHKASRGIGRVFVVVYCFFALVWVASYTANLAALLSQPLEELPAESISDVVRLQAEGVMGPACVKAGTAYEAWLNTNVADLDTLGVDGSYEELASALRAGDCDTIIDADVFADYMTHSPTFCSDNLVVGSDPLDYGLSDMGIGIRVDMPEVRDAISYWIETLHSCSADARGSACYNGLNSAGLYRKWILRPLTCSDDTDLSNESDGESLSARNFFFPLLLTWVAGIAVLLRELASPKMHARIDSMVRKMDLLLYLQEKHRDSWDGVAFDLDCFLVKWWESASLRDEVLPYVERHYLDTDVQTWRFLRESASLVPKEDQLVMSVLKGPDAGGVELRDKKGSIFALVCPSEGSLRMSDLRDSELSDSELGRGGRGRSLEGSAALTSERPLGLRKGPSKRAARDQSDLPPRQAGVHKRLSQSLPPLVSDLSGDAPVAERHISTIDVLLEQQEILLIRAVHECIFLRHHELVLKETKDFTPLEFLDSQSVIDVIAKTPQGLGRGFGAARTSNSNVNQLMKSAASPALRSPLDALTPSGGERTFASRKPKNVTFLDRGSVGGAGGSRDSVTSTRRSSMRRGSVDSILSRMRRSSVSVVEEGRAGVAQDKL
uniref:Ionotropic glutamate receptor C-terminal domain-containing protein n=1 Tax=Phaeomonas parva TaxID=124430 RepID=A0A7S1UDF6_9STRA